MRVKDPWYPYPEAPPVQDILVTARQTFVSMLLASIFGGGIDAIPASGLFRNMLRLLIRACEEYESAIAEIVAAIEHRETSNIIFAASHWEGCIEATHRAISMAEVFRRQLGIWAPDTMELRIEKSARFTDEDVAPIREMRHAIQHLDEELIKFKAQPGDKDRGSGIFVYSDAHGIRFHGIEIQYQHLARILSRLGKLCTWLNMQEVPAGHPLAHPDRKTNVKITGAEAFRKPFGSDP